MADNLSIEGILLIKEVWPTQLPRGSGRSLSGDQHGGNLGIIADVRANVAEKVIPGYAVLVGKHKSEIVISKTP